VDILIKEGHPPDVVGEYSLGQILLYIDLICKRYQRQSDAYDKDNKPKNKNTVVATSYRENPLASHERRKRRK